MFEGKSNETIRKSIIAEQGGACNHCLITEWRGKPITLELEHKDGNNQNNSRDNLECICPNCHSQTDTWRGRNKARRKNVSDEDMIAKLRETGSMYQTLVSFGMAPKGGNYVRTKRLVAEHGIELMTHGGVRCAHAKINAEGLAKLRAWRAEGKSYYWIAAQLGVSRSTVASAHQGKTYK